MILPACITEIWSDFLRLQQNVPNTSKSNEGEEKYDIKTGFSLQGIKSAPTMCYLLEKYL